VAAFAASALLAAARALGGAAGSPAVGSFGVAAVRAMRAGASWVGGRRVGPAGVLTLAAALSLVGGFGRAVCSLVLLRLAVEVAALDAGRRAARERARQRRDGGEAASGGRSGERGGWAEKEWPPPRGRE
jgi:hypothetical protein